MFDARLASAHPRVRSVVVFGAGWPFFRAAARAARHGATNMDTLIALGALAAWTGSTWTLERHPQHAHLYYETAAMIVALILLGRWLEARAKRRAADAIHGLAALRPRTARVVRNSVEHVVPVDSLRSGDHVLIMSNGGFGGIHGKLLARLRERHAASS